MARNRRGRKGSGFKKIIFFLVVGYIGFNMLTSKNTTQATSTSGANASRTQNQQGTANNSSNLSASYALQPLTNNWPNADELDNVTGLEQEYLNNNYYVILDASGSMKESECTDGSSKMKVAIDALQEFANSLPTASNFGLALFHDGNIKELIPLGNSNRQGVRSMLSGIYPSGATPLRSSLDFAYKKITTQAKRQLGYGEYHIVMLTDGLASEGESPGKVVNAILEESPVNIQTIGFCIGLNHILNQPGRSQYKAADNVEELRTGLKDVLAESPDFDVSSF